MSRVDLSSIEARVLPLTSDEWGAVLVFLRLSKRQCEIVELILRDFPEVSIAYELSISPRTVHAHLERLYRKLGVHSRCQLIIAVFDAYLTTCCSRVASRS